MNSIELSSLEGMSFKDSSVKTDTRVSKVLREC